MQRERSYTFNMQSQLYLDKSYYKDYNLLTYNSQVPTGTSILPFSSKVFENSFILRSSGAGMAQSV